MERLLNGKKNIIISEKLGGGYKVINAGGPWGNTRAHGIRGFS